MSCKYPIRDSKFLSQAKLDTIDQGSGWQQLSQSTFFGESPAMPMGQDRIKNNVSIFHEVRCHFLSLP
jgi:hypothetical protein